MKTKKHYSIPKLETYLTCPEQGIATSIQGESPTATPMIFMDIEEE